jgi:hypothetical protein
MYPLQQLQNQTVINMTEKEEILNIRYYIQDWKF